MNDSAVNLLQLVGENLRASDPDTYRAIETAINAGARPEIQITFGPDARLALGIRDDYERVRWTHSMPLQ